MKTLSISLFCLLLILQHFTVSAQTADRITYDIIYDVSGSVPIFDTHGNLKSLLQQMVQITGKDQIHSYADFRIYFIGGDSSKVLGANSYLSIHSSDLKKSKRLIDSMEHQIAGSRQQKYTYMHTALDLIVTEGRAKHMDKDKVAGGVFIFSDGQIGENDFEHKAGDALKMDRAHYLRGINQRIATIEQALHKPVFIIQSYLLPQNEFAIIPDSSKFPNVSKDQYTTRNWFWVKSTNDADTGKKVRSAFENFIAEANITIVNSNQLISKNDTVATSIKLEQIFNLIKGDDQQTLASVMDRVFPMSLADSIPDASAAQFKAAVQTVVKLSGAKTYTQDDVISLQKAINLLAKAPELIRQLQTNVAMDAGTKFTLSSDQSLAAAAFPAKKADVTAVKTGGGESFQSMMLNGIAKYLVDRVKEEIALYFIDEVNQQSLNNKYKYREIGMFLLPNTKLVVQNPANYTDINALKTAFLKDVDQLPDNLAKHADLFGRSEGIVALKYFYQLYGNIRQTNSLEISFEELAKTIENTIQRSPSMVNVGRIDNNVSRIEQSILFTSRLVGYLRRHDLSKIYLQQQPDTLSKILSLLSLDSKYISSIKDVNKLGPIINDIYTHYQDLKNTIEKYQPVLTATPANHIQDFNIDQFTAVTEILGKISGLMLAGAPVLDLMKFNDTTAVTILSRISQRISAYNQDIPVRIGVNVYNLKFTRDKNAVSLEFHDQAGEMISTGKVFKEYQEIKFDGMTYGFRILNFADINATNIPLTFVLEPAIDSLTARFSNTGVVQSAENCLQAYFLFRQHKYADAVNLMLPDINLALRDRFGSDTVALERINSVFRIAGGVINATSSNDIETVIAKNAVPAGGYKNKRNSRETFYLNAYAGAALTDYTTNSQVTVALFAPVGFEYAFGRRGNSKNFQSIGIMLNILDVGNIINYQLANNGADQNDVTSLSRAFAPGLYVTYGISSHHPLSLIAGYQMNPGRFNLGLAFDLPVFPFIQKK